MGVFDTIIGGAQSIWGTITGSQAAADVGGYGSQQQPATVTVQPKPPIVTSVKPAAGGGYTTTVSQSPNVPAPVTVQQTVSAQPKPPIIATVTPSKTGLVTTLTQSPNVPSPVSVPAPSIQESVLRGVNVAAAGSQAAVMDLTGLRSIQLQAKQQEIQKQQAAYETRLAGINIQTANLQNRATLLEQRNTALQSAAGELNAFIGTIPAAVSTPEEYGLAMQKVQIAQKASGQLQQEEGRLQGEYAGLSGEAATLQKESTYAQFEGIRLQQQGANLNAEAAMVADTGIGGATNWFEENINKPASDYLLTNIGKPFGLSKEDVALSLAINKQIAETTFNYAPLPQTASYAYGAGMVEETLMKPGEAGIWAGIGLATGGIGRALGPVGKRLAAAGAIEGAGTGAKILGKAAQYGPKLLGYGMGAFYAVDVGGEVLSQPTAGAKISKLGGISGTQILPMFAGGMIGYKAPEIGAYTKKQISTGASRIAESPSFQRELRGMRTVYEQNFGRIEPGRQSIKWIENPSVGPKSPTKMIQVKSEGIPQLTNYNYATGKFEPAGSSNRIIDALRTDRTQGIKTVRTVLQGVNQQYVYTEKISGVKAIRNSVGMESRPVDIEARLVEDWIKYPETLGKQRYQTGTPEEVRLRSLESRFFKDTISWPTERMRLTGTGKPGEIPRSTPQNWQDIMEGRVRRGTPKTPDWGDIPERAFIEDIQRRNAKQAMVEWVNAGKQLSPEARVFGSEYGISMRESYPTGKGPRQWGQTDIFIGSERQKGFVTGEMKYKVSQPAQERITKSQRVAMETRFGVDVDKTSTQMWKEYWETARPRGVQPKKEPSISLNEMFRTGRSGGLEAPSDFTTGKNIDAALKVMEKPSKITKQEPSVKISDPYSQEFLSTSAAPAQEYRGGTLMMPSGPRLGSMRTPAVRIFEDEDQASLVGPFSIRKPFTVAEEMSGIALLSGSRIASDLRERENQILGGIQLDTTFRPEIETTRLNQVDIAKALETSMKLSPIITPSVKTAQIPDIALGEIQSPIIGLKELQIQTPETALIQIPTEITTELQITELQTPEIQIPRLDYGYDFRLPDFNIPPFPPLVIPGFPGGIGGGGGGGGFGGQGGMLFEELFPLGEDVDVFGMGDLDMGAYVRANTPRTARKKRKRRK